MMCMACYRIYILDSDEPNYMRSSCLIPNDSSKLVVYHNIRHITSAAVGSEEGPNHRTRLTPNRYRHA